VSPALKSVLRPAPTGSRTRAVTLVELVCAVALLALLMTCLGAVVTGTLARTEDVVARGALLRRAAGLADLLEADLRNAVPAPSAGEKSLKLSTEGEGARPRVRLELLTTCCYAGPAAPAPRVLLVRYDAVPADGERLALSRREWAWDAMSPDERRDPPEHAARRVDLAADLRAWRAWVLDKGRWLDGWRGSKDLPAGIRVEFEIGAQAPEPGRVVVAWPTRAPEPTLSR